MQELKSAEGFQKEFKIDNFIGVINKTYIKLSLDDYYLFYTSKNNLNLVDISRNKKELFSPSYLGKINLIEKFLYSKMKNFDGETQSLNQLFFSLVYGYYDETRYEFLHYSKNLNVLVVGNRSGDIQIYDLVLHE